MSRVLESEAYLGGGPGMEFAIDPSERLFVDVRGMSRFRKPIERERNIKVGLIRRIGARIWIELDQQKKEDTYFAGMYFRFEEFPRPLDIASKGKDVWKFFKENNYRAGYREDPDEGVNIGIETSFGGRINLVIPPAGFSLPVSTVVELPTSSYEIFNGTLTYLNRATSFGIDTIHRFLGHMPGKVKYTFNLRPSTPDIVKN